MKKLLLITVILITANLLFSQIINIPEDYPKIQQGLNAANNGDTVLVQPGTYYENINIIPGEITLASLMLTTGDTSYIAQTIIDGNPFEPLINIFSFAESINCRIVGFTIRHGVDYDYTEYGGGINYTRWVNNADSLLLKNLVITGNQAQFGGGISLIAHHNEIDSGYVLIDHVTISSNRIGGGYDNGGGIYCENVNPSLFDVKIESNQGGGALFYNSTPVLTNVHVTSNSSLDYWNPRAGMYFENSHPVLQNIFMSCNDHYALHLLNSTVEITDAVFDSNQYGINLENADFLMQHIVVSNSEGEGITINNSTGVMEHVAITGCGNRGLAIFDSNPVIKQVELTDNDGGIYCNNSSPLIENSWISGNIANSYPNKGGGLACIDNSNPVLVNVLIFSNSAEDTPNRIGKGGGIYCDNSSPKLINTTIADNSCESQLNGGGVFCDADSHPQLINSLIWGNTSPCITLATYDAWHAPSINIQYSLVEGGESAIFIPGEGSVVWLEGNINEDPLFVMSDDHLYQINDYSPCIDAGTLDTTGLNLPEFDLAGNLRFINDRIDMGAYEWNLMVSVDEPEAGTDQVNGIWVYPNPVVNVATINVNAEIGEFDFIKLCNSAGTELKSWNKTDVKTVDRKLTIEMSNLPPGTYFLRLQAGNEVVTKKVVKL